MYLLDKDLAFCWYTYGAEKYKSCHAVKLAATEKCQVGSTSKTGQPILDVYTPSDKSKAWLHLQEM